MATPGADDPRTRSRPEHPEYFMRIAMAVRKRANCLGTRVGAVLALEDRVISTGYNGTPEDAPNCLEGGCIRCANREDKYKSGEGYDRCICVHAEQNALLSAARFGISVDGAILYTTHRPCPGCTKELLQARVKQVLFLNDWEHPDPEVATEHASLLNRIPEGVKQVPIEDDDAAWAIPPKGPTLADTGHAGPDS